MDEILIYFTEDIKQKIKMNLIENVEEIRIRSNKPIILKNSKTEKQINYIMTPDAILQILQKICDNSIYSYQNQICNGFITLKGGHRVRNYRKCGHKRWTSYQFELYKQFEF